MNDRNPDDAVVTAGSEGVVQLDAAGAWQRLQTLLLTTTELDAFLVDLSALGAAVVTPAASCGITSTYDGRPLTVASSDERAGHLDERQYVDGSGPCLHTLATGEVVAIDDLDTETRWPAFVEDARGRGLRSSLSVPLELATQTLGAMNFYAFSGPGAFGDDERAQCVEFAAQASGAVQLLTRNLENTALVDQLEQALSSRSVVDQALGVLMARRSCTSEEAFEVLRIRSQSEQRRLREIAAEVIHEVTGTPPVDRGRFRRG